MKMMAGYSTSFLLFMSILIHSGVSQDPDPTAQYSSTAVPITVNTTENVTQTNATAVDFMSTAETASPIAEIEFFNATISNSVKIESEPATPDSGAVTPPNSSSANTSSIPDASSIPSDIAVEAGGTSANPAELTSPNDSVEAIDEANTTQNPANTETPAPTQSEATHKKTDDQTTEGNTVADAPAKKSGKSLALGICIPLLLVCIVVGVFIVRRRCKKVKKSGSGYLTLGDERRTFGGLQNPTYDLDL